MAEDRERFGKRWGLQVVSLVLIVLLAGAFGLTYEQTQSELQQLSDLRNAINNLSLQVGGMQANISNLKSAMDSLLASFQLSAMNLSSVSVTSALGIRLSLSLGTTVVNQGEDPSISVEVFNVLSHMNNLSVAGFPRTSQGFPFTYQKCAPEDTTPYSITLYQGYYDALNISIAKPQFIMCPGIPMTSTSLANYEYYVFQSNSSDAVLYGLTMGGTSAISDPMHLTTEVPINTWYASFNGFLPVGVYTILAQDLWGQIAILHFLVVP